MQFNWVVEIKMVQNQLNLIKSHLACVSDLQAFQGRKESKFQIDKSIIQFGVTFIHKIFEY